MRRWSPPISSTTSTGPCRTDPLATQTVAMASAKPRRGGNRRSAPRTVSTWDQTSLIGKIFIAFGALLTMASAARMFMA